MARNRAKYNKPCAFRRYCLKNSLDSAEVVSTISKITSGEKVRPSTMIIYVVTVNSIAAQT
ncbi:MAG: hypothetical protein K2F88_01365 [Duncaniella sp.]|nr:hypothetical protein [Duncaniella sp.]